MVELIIFLMLRLVFPDLDEGTADKWVQVRRLDGAGAANWEGPLAVDGVELVPVKAGNARQVLLQFRAGADDPQPDRTVALFEVGPGIRLLDVGTISAWPDDYGSLEKSKFSLNADTEVFETVTDHSNSQQGYEGRRYFFVAGERLHMIYDAELLNGQCIGGENFRERLSIGASPDPGLVYQKVTIKIALEMLPDTDCPEGHRTRKTTRMFSGVFRWDAGRREFVTTSKELDALEAFNERRR